MFFHRITPAAHRAAILALLLLSASSARAQFGFGGSGDPGQATAQAPRHSAVMLRRFLMTSTQQHFYTNDQGAKYDYQSAHQENPAGYILPAGIPGLVPFYRLSKPGDGYFYTISEASKKSAMTTAGFQLDGIIGYVSAVKTPDTSPLFRLYRAAKPRKPGTPSNASNYPDHFYTTDAAEKDGAVKNYGYVDEGIEGYLWTKPTIYSGSGVPADGSYHPLPYIQAAIALNKRYETHFGAPNTDSNRTDALIAKLRSGPSARETQYQAGLKPEEADEFFVALLQNDRDERQLIIDTVYNQVYGQPASFFGDSPDDKKWQAQLKSGKGSYGLILLAELIKLSNQPDLRRTMIDRAYITTMGRQPIDRLVIGKEKTAMQGEQTYWMPRKEYFSQIVSASRDWLYSPAGNADLVASIDRALKFRLNKTPSDSQRQAELSEWKSKRAIFAEKVAPQSFEFYASQIHQQAKAQAEKAAEPSKNGWPGPIVVK